jgi:hypothetical protein
MIHQWEPSNADKMRKELDSVFPDRPRTTDEQLLIMVQRMKEGYTFFNIHYPPSGRPVLFTDKHFEFKWFGELSIKDGE